jgi:hypothetical protein
MGLCLVFHTDKHFSNANEPVIISLHDDNTEAVIKMIKFLHFDGQLDDNVKMGSWGGLDKLTPFLIACDKYECMNALQFVIQHWLNFLHTRFRDFNIEECYSLLNAAYISDDAKLFEAVSKTIVFDHPDAHTDDILERVLKFSTSESSMHTLPLEVYGRPYHSSFIKFGY